MFIIHNYDVINISYNMSQLKYNRWPSCPPAPFARLSPTTSLMAAIHDLIELSVLQKPIRIFWRKRSEQINFSSSVGN